MSNTQKKLRSSLIPLAILLALLGAIPVSTAAAQVHRVTFNFDQPTTPRPGPGMMCTVNIESPDNTLQSRTDVGEILANLRVAAANSSDMQVKLADACRKNGGSITIHVVRDDPNVMLAHAVIGGPMKGHIFLDNGDIRALRDPGALTGDARDISSLVAVFVTRALAHEIDHLRHTAADNHLDPGAGRGLTGPAVDDANQVLLDLGRADRRNSYGYLDPATGHHVIDFTIGGRLVVLDLSRFVAARRAVGRFVPALPDVYELDEDLLDTIPDRQCGSGSCWQDVLGLDADLDGVSTLADNCGELANPQQSDVDGDGLGTGCDPDDDGDGIDWGFEEAMGSSDLDATRTPEHYLATGLMSGAATCSDGIDNDGDGVVDGDDPSCLEPVPSTNGLPRHVEPGGIFEPRLRLDRGGVPDGTDVMPIEANIVVDGDWISLSGLAAVRRETATAGSFGATMPFELTGLSLHGPSETLGDVLITLGDVATSDGRVIGLDAAGESDFPAQVELALHLVLRDGGELLDATTEPVHLTGEIGAWPFFGQVQSQEGGAPVAFRDREGRPVRGIDFFSMSGAGSIVGGCGNWLHVSCANECVGGICCLDAGSGLPMCSAMCTPGGPGCR